MFSDMATKLARGKRLATIGFALFCGLCTFLISGCSPGNATLSVASPTPTPTATPTAKLLVSDNTSGAVDVVDATTDRITATLAVASPGKMVSAGGTTIIQSTLSSSVAIFDNATESIRFTVVLPAQPVDVAITPDGTTAWVAENNGTVQSINTATSATISTFAVGGVQRIVLGPQGTTVVAFNDGVATTFAAILPTGLVPAIGNPTLDHPTNAVFFGNDQNFILLNCGIECGGLQPSIADVQLSPPLGGGPAISTPLSVSGATVGLLSGTTVFVAGSPGTSNASINGLNTGTLQVANSTGTTVGTPFHIADGRHNLMTLSSNGRLYIGSTGCTLGPPNPQNFRQGCLTIFDTVAQTVTPVLLPASRLNGDVTAMAPVAGRNVIYVVHGGVIDIFDITTNAVSTTAVPPVPSGTAFGVVQLSP